MGGWETGIGGWERVMSGWETSMGCWERGRAHGWLKNSDKKLGNKNAKLKTKIYG